MKGIIQCFVCGENHHYKIEHSTLAFVCPFLNGVIHLEFYSAQEIEKHKKENEPKSWKNIFRKKEANNGS